MQRYILDLVSIVRKAEFPEFPLELHSKSWNLNGIAFKITLARR